MSMENTTVYVPQFRNQRRWSAHDEEKRIRRIDGEAHGAIKAAVALLEKGDRSGWDFVVKGILERVAMNDLRIGVKRHFFETCPRVLIPKELKKDWCRMQDKILHTALDQAIDNPSLWEEIVTEMGKLNAEGELRPGVRARLVELCPPDLLPLELKFEGEEGVAELKAVLTKPSVNRAKLDVAKAARRAERHAAQPKKGFSGGGNDSKKGGEKK